jgi:alkanesulfonate monooxygenase SsuD/methylene tetrahydromethanopterin reductase-like flavin-dependent oxidoreductase (luciferase family)
MSARELRFGLNVPTAAGPGHDPVATAIRAERLGFDFVSSSDHPAGTAPNFETWTMLCWIAAATSRIGIATRVLGVPYRAPAMVAKMAETFDRLSGGRMILGLGGGSSDDEHRAFGLGVRTPREKVDGLAEAVTIVRGLWSQESFSFDGRLYRTEAARLEPKPGRAIPIWLGTFGPRALAVTGRLADGWIPSYGYAAPDELLRMRERVVAAAVTAGRDEDAVTCALNVDVEIAERPTSDASLSGAPHVVAEQLGELASAGFTAFNFMPVGPDAEQQAERIVAELVPALRAG